MYEVPVALPGVSGVFSRCWSMLPEEGLADKVRIEGWSADMAKGKLFSCRNRSLKEVRCNGGLNYLKIFLLERVMGWDQNLLIEEHYYLPKY